MKITQKKFQNIITMLRSTDQESGVLALSLIDELDFNNNITAILLLKKYSNSNNSMWQNHAPKTWSKLEGLQKQKHIDLNSTFTYKTILNAITRLKVPVDQIEFYLTDFSNYLLNQFKHMGYDFIEHLDITIKTKENEQNGEFSESL